MNGKCLDLCTYMIIKLAGCTVPSMLQHEKKMLWLFTVWSCRTFVIEQYIQNIMANKDVYHSLLEMSNKEGKYQKKTAWLYLQPEFCTGK